MEKVDRDSSYEILSTFSVGPQLDKKAVISVQIKIDCLFIINEAAMLVPEANGLRKFKKLAS